MPVSICFVCLGNICRSPTAEGIMLQLIDQHGLAGLVEVDSAGTGAYHTGEKADGRSRATAEGHGVPLPSISRQFSRADFDRFDYVIAMDADNQRNLQRIAPLESHLTKITLVRNYDGTSTQNASVPDPYYNDGFEDVFQICKRGCEGLLKHIAQEHKLTLKAP